MEIFDKFTRPMRDLRLSVIDACNFRCLYCMPPDRDYDFFQKNEMLSVEEAIRLSEIFVELGVRRIRLTGGEPLLRKDLDQIIAGIAKTPNLEDLALTTNASLLADKAQMLKDTGIKRLTISLDALDPNLFKQMSGGRSSVDQVIKGIDAALDCGFSNTKLNCVIEKGLNESQIIPLTEFARERQLKLRFIEFMDVGNCNQWNLEKVVPSAEVKKIISAKWPLTELEPKFYGEVAKAYQFEDGQGEIGFISSVTQAFCKDCTRARISSDGKLYTCLFCARGTDLLSPMRQDQDDSEIAKLIKNVWEKRTNRYSEERMDALKHPRQHDIVEMFKMGG